MYHETLGVGEVLVLPCHAIVFELITLQTDVAGLRCGMLVEDDVVGRSKYQDQSYRATTPSSHVSQQRQPTQSRRANSDARAAQMHNLCRRRSPIKRACNLPTLLN